MRLFVYGTLLDVRTLAMRGGEPVYRAVMPGEGPASTSCGASLGKDVDTGPSPGMMGSGKCVVPDDSVVAPRTRVPAILRGWRRVAMRGGRYPTLRRHLRGLVAGALVTVSARVRGRLAAYEGPAYRLVRVVVDTSSGKTAAYTWIAPGGTRLPWRE